MLQAADAALRNKLSPEVLSSIVALIPDAWLGDVLHFADVEAHREAYHQYLVDRLRHSSIFVQEAIHARTRLA
jgi:hypothetical protein